MVRKVFTHILWLTGLLAILRYARRKQVTIMTLHGVIDSTQASWHPLRSFHEAEQFESAVKVLSQKHNLISLNHAVEIINGQREPVDHALVLTFDDGYSNAIECALPILRNISVPMALFPVTSSIVEPQPFWFDRLDFAMQRNLEGKDVLKYGETAFTVDMSDHNSARKSVVSVVRGILAAEKDDEALRGNVDSFINSIEERRGQRLADQFQTDICSRQCTLEQIVAHKDDELLEIGSHTVNHSRLVFLDAERCSEELLKSREFLQEHLGYCDIICYPNGLADKAVAKHARQAGYSAGLTGIEGQNSIGGNPMLLKRINMPVRCSRAELLCLAVGIGTS